MEICVIGLGYVGLVTAASLAAAGHRVIGVDIDPYKVTAINQGRSPLLEPGLDQLVAETVAASRLTAVSQIPEAISSSILSFVCVGTPSKDNGALDLRFVERVTREIGAALRAHSDYHVVAFRSTMLPGTVRGRLLPLLATQSQRVPGQDFGVVMNPEFMREGSSLRDFHKPSRFVIGQLTPRSGDTTLAAYPAIIEATPLRTTLEAAEMLKYADNAFHALKITFANEIGNICQLVNQNAGRDEHLEFPLDARQLMESFCQDTKLNLSSMYLKPGSAFGGSCLPKDLRAILHFARSSDLSLPLLASVLTSNELQKQRAFALVSKSKKKKVGILGLSFKRGTDDLRESPAVHLVEALLGKGFDVLIYDRDVSVARLIGSNREYIEREIPHVGQLLRESLSEVVEHAEVLVVTRADPEYQSSVEELPEDKLLVDLAGVLPPDAGKNQLGICW